MTEQPFRQQPGRKTEQQPGQKTEQQKRGSAAEAAVARHLTGLGYYVLAQNYAVPRLGELDLVLQLGRTIYFVEVKARSRADHFGGALAAITPAKLARLRKTALFYLQKERYMNSDVAFLAADVRLTEQGEVADIVIVPVEYQ
jgi:putative endonuclease